MVSLACVHTQTSCTCGHKHLDSTEVEGSLAVVRARINVGASVHQEPHDLASTDTHVTCIWRIQTHMTHAPAPASTKSPTLWRDRHISRSCTARTLLKRGTESAVTKASLFYCTVCVTHRRAVVPCGTAYACVCVYVCVCVHTCTLICITHTLTFGWSFHAA